jgi:hypothetical protein
MPPKKKPTKKTVNTPNKTVAKKTVAPPKTIINKKTVEQWVPDEVESKTTMKSEKVRENHRWCNAIWRQKRKFKSLVAAKHQDPSCVDPQVLEAMEMLTKKGSVSRRREACAHLKECFPEEYDKTLGKYDAAFWGGGRKDAGRGMERGRERVTL